MDELDFLHFDKHQTFLQVDSIVFAGRGQARLKYPEYFAISLQYIKKEGRDEDGFWHGDKHQTFLRVGIINFGGQASHVQSTVNKFAKSLQYLKIGSCVD